MPRRKRTTPQNEGQRKARRTNDEDEETLVISDSENEEEENTANRNQSSRGARWQERENRAQMEDMTEEEMLDLAMRLSKQEASSAAQRQQLEDDDMRKAIAESLHVTQSRGVNSKSANATKKPCEEPTTVNRKLSFKREMTRTGDKVTAEAESDEDSTQDIKPLLPMPELSQKTSPEPSPPSPATPAVPSTGSQESHNSQCKEQDEQEVHAELPEDEPSQSNSQRPCLPAFFQKCSVRLNQISTSRGSTQNSSLSLTCPSTSQVTQQQSPSAFKSPVFAKTDPKESTALDKGSCISRNLTDKVCTPVEEQEEEERLNKPPSHTKEVSESRDHRKRLSLCRKVSPSLHVSVPEETVSLKQEADQPKQLKPVSSLGTSLNSALEKVPNNKSLEEFTSYMVLHLSDDDDDDDEEEEKVVVPSPVFHQEHAPHTGHPRLSPTQPCGSPPPSVTTQDLTHTPSLSTQDSGPQPVCSQKKFTSKTIPRLAESDQKGEELVSYYWGIPFCPRGQNPDDYTRVILSQLEVYEKSLKETQHQLLHKAEWSLPLFPCPAGRFVRRMKRHRAPLLLEEEDEEPEKEKEEKKKQVEERVESQTGSEKEEENGQDETYVVVSSPETQEVLVQKSPLLSRQHESSDAVKPSSCRNFSPQDLSDDTQIQQPDKHEDVQNETYNAESTVCPETQMTEDNTPELMVTSPAQPQSRAESEGMEVDEEAGEDEGMEQEQSEEVQQQRESVPCLNVECPMCSCLFPMSKIEMHAAYCDGSIEEQEQQDDLSQGVTLRKRNRRIAMEEPLSKSEKSEQQEKCYVCQKLFLSKEYSNHVDKCLQQNRSRRSQGNGLLSALHEAEQEPVDVDSDKAGPSDIMVKKHGGLAESPVVGKAGENRDGSTSGFYVSSSPIKSFTPISEVRDCLIDFQQQYSARTHQRLGRKRKFKR